MTVDAKVPCNGCTACCRGELVVITEEDGDPGQWETVPMEIDTGAVDEDIRCLATKFDGSCVYLGEGCTIYERRPAMCRAFDCRGMAKMLGIETALALAARGDPVMKAALERIDT